VLTTLVFREREIQTKEGQWRLVRIMPYRTHENLIDGLVITFVDIDWLKRAQRSDNEARAHSEDIVDAIDTGLLVVDAQQTVVSANRAFYDLFATSSKRVIGQRLNAFGDGLGNLSKLIDAFPELIADGDRAAIEIARVTPRPNDVELAISARRLSDRNEPSVLVIFEPQG
jgi:two-component system CheB/CheR fusion protein